ncbi:RNA cytidine acetyltransferase 2-like protein, partial [Drosera capensis]
MTTRVKADERIRTLINNGAKTRHRSMFVIIGDKSIMNLHRVLSDAKLKARPTILWCYKDKLDLSSNKRRRTKQVKKLLREGSLDPQRADAFSLFLETSGITYCMYKDSERVLGNTFDMCILQDFGAMTPNLLARTIETVEGGGLIVLLLRSLASLTALYTMVMDSEDLLEAEHGRAVITFLDAILDKTLCSTVALLAARGRGKSAALGLAVAGAIAAGCVGLSISKKEHIDFDVVRSSNPEFKKAIVRINVYKYHRQTIQYIMPNEHEKLSQVELLVIDEAAAIPLPVVKSLLGPYLVFISSTVNGYEGTGRSLSLKLLQQLAEQSQTSTKNVESSLSGRLFKKIELTESIRYASGDPIESWLNGLLCLDVANSIPDVSRFTFVVEVGGLQSASVRDGVSSLGSPQNDVPLCCISWPMLQLTISLCCLVALEGQISRKSAIRILSNGHQPHGDQIPWKFSEQFMDTVFLSLSGARIVRIATHLLAMWNGYGSIAVEILSKYYEGEFLPFSEVDFVDTLDKPPVRLSEAAEKNAVTGEHTCMVIKPLNSDEISVDESDERGFFSPFYQDFRQRFRRLLPQNFHFMDYQLAMRCGLRIILDTKINFADSESEPPNLDGIRKSIEEQLSPHDIKRIQAYTDSLVDFHLILDLVPTRMKLERQQVMSLFMKALKKFHKFIYGLASKQIDSTLPRLEDKSTVWESGLKPRRISLDEDVNDAAKKVE